MARLILRGTQMLLRCDYTDKDAAKSVSGYRWDKVSKAWAYPIKASTFHQLRMLFPAAEVDAGLLELVQAAAAADKKISEMKSAGWAEAVPAAPMPIKTSPFLHQIHGFNLAISQRAHGLLYEQGCGKTLTAIAAIGHRWLQGEVVRVLVVAPSSVVPVWENEFAKHADFPHTVTLLEGSTAVRTAVLNNMRPPENELQVAVINYECTWRMERALASWAPDLIICDESQRIKTPSAKQSKTMHRLGASAKYRMILSGTPVTQGALDFFSQYKFLDPSVFGASYYAFRGRYAVMGGFERRQVVAYQNLDELIQKAHSIALRVTKDETLDLPESLEQVIYCRLEPEAERIYRELAARSIVELGEEKVITAAHVLTKLLRLSQITGGFLPSEENKPPTQISTAKLDALAELLSDLGDKKVVIFARFLAEIEAIKKMLAAKGVSYSWITGAVKQSDRGEMVRRFQECPEVRVFVAQIQTAGLGITLHAADTAIFYSLDYSYANLEQAMARLHRIGQTRNVTNIFLITRGAIDERIKKVLGKKQDVAAMVVDNWREILQ